MSTQKIKKVSRETNKKLSTISQIALKHLSCPTLETRMNNDQDFHDLAVWNIEKALSEAYDAGQLSTQEKVITTSPIWTIYG